MRRFFQHNQGLFWACFDRRISERTVHFMHNWRFFNDFSIENEDSSLGMLTERDCDAGNWRACFALRTAAGRRFHSLFTGLSLNSPPFPPRFPPFSMNSPPFSLHFHPFCAPFTPCCSLLLHCLLSFTLLFSPHLPAASNFYTKILRSSASSFFFFLISFIFHLI